nr:hypothetical protein [uncultured Campylobacter sp.]
MDAYTGWGAGELYNTSIAHRLSFVAVFLGACRRLCKVKFKGQAPRKAERLT